MGIAVSFNQTPMYGGHRLSADISADLSRWKSKEAMDPAAGLSNWILVQ